jgi:hypothetical protein
VGLARYIHDENHVELRRSIAPRALTFALDHTAHKDEILAPAMDLTLFHTY